MIPFAFLLRNVSLSRSWTRPRRVLSNLVGAERRDLAFVRNATDGVNAVLRSFPLRRGDEVVITNHGYNACNNAVRFATQRVEALTRVAQVPFPIQDAGEVVSAIGRHLSNRTRLLVVDHVTSPTGFVFPVERLVETGSSPTASA